MTPESRTDPAVLRRLLTAEGLDAQSWSNGPGDVYGRHRHDYDKVLVAAAGSIVFELPELGREVDLAAGDRLELPAATLHAAIVGRAGVTCLEAHLPAGSLGAEPRHAAGWGSGANRHETDTSHAA
jgi:quercetin dioxygenase-like cupin family protein